MIHKPRRSEARRRYGAILEVMFIIFGLILVPFMSHIPKQIRLKALNATQKMAGVMQGEP